MRMLKKVLMWLGGLFLLFIVFAFFLGYRSSAFETEMTPFITDFVSDISQQWTLESVSDRVSNEFLQQATSAAGRETLESFRILGKVQEVREIEIYNYRTATDGTAGDFTLRARFENGDTLIQITVLSAEDGPRVQAFRIDPISQQGVFQDAASQA